MDPIPQQVVQDVQEEFKGIEEPGLREKAEALNEKQPELMAFLQASANELEQDPADLTVYLAFMIARMYEAAYGEDVPQVSPEQIIESYRQNEKIFEQMAENGAPDQPPAAEDPSQPHLLRYLTRVLTKSTEKTNEKPLNNEQKGRIFLTLKTIIDALDRKLQQ